MHVITITPLLHRAAVSCAQHNSTVCKTSSKCVCASCMAEKKIEEGQAARTARQCALEFSQPVPASKLGSQLPNPTGDAEYDIVLVQLLATAKTMQKLQALQSRCQKKLRFRVRIHRCVLPANALSWGYLQHKTRTHMLLLTTPFIDLQQAASRHGIRTGGALNGA